MNISTNSLMMALKALNTKATSIAAELETAQEPVLSDLEEELHHYSKALSELRDEYIIIQKRSQNLPPFEELIE